MRDLRRELIELLEDLGLVKLVEANENLERWGPDAVRAELDQLCADGVATSDGKHFWLVSG